jgi:hypothetical protein
LAIQGENIGAAESNAATQEIWQVQISGCTAYCKGVSQIQAAEQANLTIQALESSPRIGTASGTPAGDGHGSQATSTITQIQLGCISQCPGTGAITEPAVLASYQQTLEQLLLAIAPSFPVLGSTPAADQNAVVQTSEQWQGGQGPVLAQTEAASQLNTTVQIGAGASSLAGELQAALGLLEAMMKGVAGSLTASGSPSPTAGQAANLAAPPLGSTTGATGDQTPPGPAGPALGVAGNQAAAGLSEADAAEAVNQAAQGIWQLQIGCIFFCVETQQYQQAVQANTTIEVVTLPPGSSAETSPAVVNLATQLIWQVQIGCLFSCEDTTQQQTAASQNAMLVIASQTPQTPPPPKTSGTPPGGGAEPPPTSPTHNSGSMPPPSGFAPGPNGGSNVPPRFEAVAWSTSSSRPSRPAGRTGEVLRQTAKSARPTPSTRVHATRWAHATAAGMKQRLEPAATATTHGAGLPKASVPPRVKPHAAAGGAILGSLMAGAVAIEQAEGAGWDAGAIALFAAIAFLILSSSSRAVGRGAPHRPRPSVSDPSDLT